MFTNYLKIAIRNLFKRKLFSGINLLGLSVAIGSSLLLFLTAFQEFSYDRFHENGDRIYRVYQEEYRVRGTEIKTNMPGPMQPAVMEEAPEVEHAVRWLGGGTSIEKDGQFYHQSIRYTDPAFFEMFSFRLIKGDPGRVLADLNSAVITEKIAKIVFKEEEAVGQTIKVMVDGYAKNLVVSGIAENTPDNSSVRLGVITRIENHPYYQDFRNNWDNYNHDLYVQMKEGFAPSVFEDRAKTIAEKYLQGSIELIQREGGVPDTEGQLIRFRLFPFEDLRFDTKIGRSGISKAFPVGLLIIGSFILAIACINFVNLSLGSSLERSKEVGVRKVLGAMKRQLIIQFWGEALLVVFIALAGGLMLAQWLLPEYNSLFGKSLSLFHPHLISSVAIILLFAGLLGGAYPAFVLSRFQVADVLKRKTQVQKPGRLRNLLVLVQFSFAVLLISCTIIVTQQLNFLRNKPLGFNEEEVISIPLGSEVDSKQLIDRMRNELAAYPAIKSITATYNNIGMGKDGSRMRSVMGFMQDEKEVATHWNQVDYDYLETLQIPLVEGRAFSKEFPTDSAEAVIINETFARQLTEGSPIGMALNFNPERKVIGVMQDFHFESLTNPIDALSLGLGDGDGFRFNYVFVRMTSQDIPATMALLEGTWKKINPNGTFMASFLNDNSDRLYKTEALMGKIFMSAATLAIILSGMGLFGIALLVITQRTKEIGIRKVLGASVMNIVGLVSKDFIKMVLIAIVIASPLAWIGMNKWLENYAYSIKVQWWVFLLAGLLAVIIAFATLSFQSFRAALVNPAKTLKTE